MTSGESLKSKKGVLFGNSIQPVCAFYDVHLWFLLLCLISFLFPLWGNLFIPPVPLIFVPGGCWLINGGFEMSLVKLWRWFSLSCFCQMLVLSFVKSLDVFFSLQPFIFLGISNVFLVPTQEGKRGKKSDLRELYEVTAELICDNNCQKQFFFCRP